MFAAGAHETIGNEDEGTIGIRDPSGSVTWFGSAELFVEDGPQAELVEQGTQQENGAPRPGLEDVDVGVLRRQARLAAQEAFETGQELLQQILATEVGDGALFDLAVLAVGLDNADVLVDRAAGGRNLDDAHIHVVSITTEWGDGKANEGEKNTNSVTTFPAAAASGRAHNPEKNRPFTKKR